MRRALIIIITALGIGGTAAAEEPKPVTTHYYAQTLTIDALSIGMFLGGMQAEAHDGHDTPTSNTLMSLGLLGGYFGTPVLHLVRGHGDRMLESLLMRGALASVGMVVGVETADCGNGELLCGFDRIGPGIIAGLAVASVVDAVYLTDETEEPATWAPQISASSHGAQVGLIAVF